MLLSAVCYLLAQHPDVMSRLRDKISSSLGPNEAPTHQDIKKMQYCTSTFSAWHLPYLRHLSSLPLTSEQCVP